MHDAYKIGHYWEKITNHEHRSLCQRCGVPESMEHILTECSSPGQNEVWNAAESFWQQKYNHWTRPSLGLILGCALVQHKTQSGRSLPGVDQLFRILISQSAFLIWKLRCERVITHPDEEHSAPAIVNRWTSVIADQLKLDQALTHPRFGKQALPQKMVLRTWSNTL
ncbi:hypothetical protein NEOLEDRAFT_1230941 [Neolentinus lepideus HHB14362 ss-1]|uniref:Reverse transcriptase zinc-binding domain-containing protein n=1 Tax=Neolentinus lepideus HHB14362 ss-1 TaxID=1314782 RepID=A0A165UIY3_9AGAM|nr:hypothetical protein NEOLEDRAFT_1230941 [Neolentinus lepideus HHB14362 ss-1]